MRTTDPFVFFQDHRDTIFRWSAIAGAALAVYLVLRFFAMRLGGWRAAWRRLRREIALTLYAFSAPVRAWLRHGRSLRTLMRRLSEPNTWRDAERALVSARLAAGPGRPYAALVGGSTVTVLLAGKGMPPAQGIWHPVPDDSGSWTVSRDELPPVTPEADGARPVVVALGEAHRSCVFLDVAVGPPMVCVEGDRRAGTALFRALAAQLDARLPASQVVVAEGVHPDYPGQPVRNAYRSAHATAPHLGIPPFLVAAELPDPLPPELAEPPEDVPRLRILLDGPGRGYVRTLLTDRHGRTAVPGTPLLAAGDALGPAVARILPDIPPVLPPMPAPTANPWIRRTELFEEAEAVEAPTSAALAFPPPTGMPVAYYPPPGAPVSDPALDEEPVVGVSASAAESGEGVGSSAPAVSAADLASETAADADAPSARESPGTAARETAAGESDASTPTSARRVGRP